MRVVSLLPSATETVCALGRRSSLVGRSEECDYPVEVRELPVVMRARTLDAAGPSAEIDARVRAVRSAQESLYELDVPLLARLAPDLVLTQDLCRVCSTTDDEVLEACRRAHVDPRLVSVSPRRLTEVWDSISTIGAAVGAGAAGERLARDLRSAAEGVDGAGSARPRVAVLEWVDPPIVAGLWGPDIIEAAGGIPVLGVGGEPGVRTTWSDLGRLLPDLVVVAPCSFAVPRTATEIEAARPVREGLAALRPRYGTWLADEAYFSRPGPRLADGIRLLRELLLGGPPVPRMPVQRWELRGETR